MGLVVIKRKMVISTTLVVCSVLIVLFPYSALAGWVGPTNVITALWGENPGQFYYPTGGTEPEFPENFGVDNFGNIVINDWGNNQIQIFDSQGILKHAVLPPLDLLALLKIAAWPRKLYVHHSGDFLVYYGKNQYFYSADGAMIKKINDPVECVIGDSGFVFWHSINEIHVYSPTGELLSVTSERPLELGCVTQSKVVSGQYNYKVEFPGKTWLINNIERSDENFKKDINDNLYIVHPDRVFRFNDNGIQVASMTIPDAEFMYHEFEVNGQKVEKTELVFAYGPPYIAPNGDIYTWKVTPDNYFIVKWTWQD